MTSDKRTTNNVQQTTTNDLRKTNPVIRRDSKGLIIAEADSHKVDSKGMINRKEDRNKVAKGTISNREDRRKKIAIRINSGHNKETGNRKIVDREILIRVANQRLKCKKDS